MIGTIEYSVLLPLCTMSQHLFCMWVCFIMNRRANSQMFIATVKILPSFRRAASMFFKTISKQVEIIEQGNVQVRPHHNDVALDGPQLLHSFPVV